MTKPVIAMATAIKLKKFEKINKEFNIKMKTPIKRNNKTIFVEVVNFNITSHLRLGKVNKS